MFSVCEQSAVPWRPVMQALHGNVAVDVCCTEYTATLVVMVHVMKGGGRAPPTPTSLG